MARIQWVDGARGAAVLGMIAYHFFFDLQFLGIMDVGIFDFGWKIFQRIVASSFLLVAGISLVLAQINPKKGAWIKRIAILFGIALLISVASWLYIPERFISFGIIHLIALSSLIFPLFMRLGKLRVLLAILLVIAGFFLGQSPPPDPDYLFWLGIDSIGYFPVDYFPIIPWAGVVFIGGLLGEKIFRSNGGKVEKSGMRRLESALEKLAPIGRNALLIYLAHQPVLIGILMLLISVGAIAQGR